MKLPYRKTRAAMLACGMGFASLLVAASPASAAISDVALDCQARPPIGGVQQLALDTTIDAQAPAAVAPGAAFDAILAAGALTLPTTAGGYSINNVRNLRLKMPVPAGAALRAAAVSGGANLGAGIPTVSQAGGFVTLTVPGPIAGGATFQLPAVTLSLTATGAAGGTIETKLAGTGYADPALTLTANVRAVIINVDVPTNCFASPNPTLTSTSIVDPGAASTTGS